MRSNFSEITDKTQTIWKSYAEPIAFKTADWPLTFRQNDWGVTTASHISKARSHEKGWQLGPLSGDWFAYAMIIARDGGTIADLFSVMNDS